MTRKDRFDLSNDTDFIIAIEEAQDGKPPLQTRPFKTIGDRMRLIEELEKKGFVIERKEDNFFERLKGYAKKYGWAGDHTEVIDFIIYVFNHNNKSITREDLKPEE